MASDTVGGSGGLRSSGDNLVGQVEQLQQENAALRAEVERLRRIVGVDVPALADAHSRSWTPSLFSVTPDLRHTAGTLAARTGATTKELMARLGHSSPRAAMVYQHAAEDRDRRIAEGLDAMAAEAGLAPVVPIGERKQDRADDSQAG